MSYCYEYPRASITLDAIVLKSENLEFPKVLLIKRLNPPFKGLWALPGGFMEMEETALHGAKRELEEETSLPDMPLKPVFSCSEPERDPRGRTLTVVFGCLTDKLPCPPAAADDAAELGFFSLMSPPEMAFDHARVLDEIKASLLWQAKYAIIGQDIFKHSGVSKKDFLTLHSNILGENLLDDFIEEKLSKDLIELRDEKLFYKTPSASNFPDWSPLIW